MNRESLRLCVITAAVPGLGRTHEQVAEAALAGGATMIQFRDKTMGDALFAETAARILEKTRAAGVPLMINDRAGVAEAIGADGVHIGQEDGDPQAIRNLLRKGRILGVSAANDEEARRADPADYLGTGPVYPTGSKADAGPVLGVEGLADFCRRVRQPVMAIGGIRYENLRRVLEAGAAGIAVISTVTHATDMEEAVRALRRVCDSMPA